MSNQIHKEVKLELLNILKNEIANATPVRKYKNHQLRMWGKHETRNGRHSGTCSKSGSISCWPRMSLSFLRKQADLTMRTQLQRSQFSATCLLQIVEPLKQHRTHELLNVVAASRRSFSKQRIVYLLRRSCCAALRLWSAD